MSMHLINPGLKAAVRSMARPWDRGVENAVGVEPMSVFRAGYLETPGTPPAIASVGSDGGSDPYTLAQAVESQRPHAEAGGGLPSWRFNRAAAQSLTAAGLPKPAAGSYPTMWVVFRRVATSQSGGLVDYSWDGSTNGFSLFLNGGNLLCRAHAGGLTYTVTIPSNDLDLHVARISVGSASVVGALDGVEGTPAAYAGTGLTYTQTTVEVGGLQGFGGYNLDGHIYDYSVFNDLDADQFAAGDAYYMKKFS